ncbi:MAG: tRNA (N6-isopentenyl adenosine(37)-C2)-methylthiotransferase MiaB [Eubacteriales bacterium]|nr:tRNA (N6-isopentenyl adenosine(37)-C2)-methylthiotransferase MiaB [Eubacteriales bacterium]MCI7570264.1 tRNA (N6-isopentenyl adenosine(37)-C2)-methylthiotransferase MiaB [Clostridiales bacterium]MDD7550182.1 tRNA (N6-isopentenyl adenosine(37)-C2)-methylthiotransferase MiaB [Clostridia bacterium]MDY5754876.1 tRNA (N6-isopentenyl adenosine(37)-C2)-methylthiotransferase MiaB [Eubacteriales bacterium]
MKKEFKVSQADILLQKDIADQLSGLICGTKKYYIQTYGCQMNSHDSEKIAGIFEQCGFVKASDKTSADLIVFNTCCVREHAELRVFGNVGALRTQKEENHELIIGVCGCMMQQEDVAKKLYKRYPFVDLIFGTHEMYKLPEMLSNVINGQRVINLAKNDDDIAEGIPVIRNGSFSTNVNIMYGCNNFCSYCIVPYVRGRERSRSHKDIIDEIRQLSALGYTEITLLGQNVNSYRSPDAGESIDFPGLLKLINEIDGIERIRFLTSHPKDLSHRLIEAMATLDKVCKHIHLPVQSGSTRILDEMNRKYTREGYLALVDELKKNVPGIEITTDIIVGFPGETDEDFNDTLTLVEAVGYSAAYTFKYSKRKGTKAAVMQNQVSEEVKKQRLRRLNDCVVMTLKMLNEKYIGTRGVVLVEGCDDTRSGKMAFGKLSNFKTVYFPGDESLIGQYLVVSIDEVMNNSLKGTLVSK